VAMVFKITQKDYVLKIIYRYSITAVLNVTL